MNRCFSSFCVSSFGIMATSSREFTARYYLLTSKATDETPRPLQAQLRPSGHEHRKQQLLLPHYLWRPCDNFGELFHFGIVTTFNKRVFVRIIIFPAGGKPGHGVRAAGRIATKSRPRNAPRKKGPKQKATSGPQNRRWRWAQNIIQQIFGRWRGGGRKGFLFFIYATLCCY